MVTGVDTGFFIELAKGNSVAKELWNKVSNGDEELVVSVISLNEIIVHFYRIGNIEEKDKWINLINAEHRVSACFY